MHDFIYDQCEDSLEVAFQTDEELVHFDENVRAGLAKYLPVEVQAWRQRRTSSLASGLRSEGATPSQTTSCEGTNAEKGHPSAQAPDGVDGVRKLPGSGGVRSEGRAKKNRVHIAEALIQGICIFSTFIKSWCASLRRSPWGAMPIRQN